MGARFTGLDGWAGLIMMSEGYDFRLLRPGTDIQIEIRIDIRFSADWSMPEQDLQDWMDGQD